MTFSDSDLLPLSALQHFIYCPRQCALIHLEQQWTENRFTAEGRAQHDRVDRPEHETRDGIRYEYAVLLRSLKLGLIGKADVVEFHLQPKAGYSKSETPNLKSQEQTLRVFPVEHKRGRPKPTHCDWVQLCAQALCLEETLGVEILEGAIFYGLPRRRQPVELTPELRKETKATAAALHRLVAAGKTPPAEYIPKKCSACSLLEICMPKRTRRVANYLAESAFEIPNPQFEIEQSEL